MGTWPRIIARRSVMGNVAGYSDYLLFLPQILEPLASKVGRRGTVVLPAKLRHRLGIEEGSFVVAEEREDGISAKKHSPSRDRDTGCVEWDAYFSLPDRGGMRKHPIKRRFGYPKHRYRWRCALSEPQSVTH